LDSLRLALEEHPQRDTVRFSLLIRASDHFYSNPVERKNYIEQALSLAIELDFKKGIAEAHIYLTYYFMDRLEYADGIDNGLKALRVYENLHDQAGLYEAYNVLAGIYNRWGDFNKAREYMHNMEELVSRNSSLVDMQDFYYNMGFFTLQQKNFEEGVGWITKALAIYQERKNKYGIATCYFLLAKAEHGLGNTEAELHYYLKCIQVNKMTNHPEAIANTTSAHEGVGKIYIKLKEWRKAALHLDTSFVAATQMGSVNMLLKIYDDRGTLHEEQGNFKEALKYVRLNKVLSDSVLNKEKSKQLADAQTKYETEKKEQTITLLNQEKKFQNQLTYFLIAGFVLLGMAAVAIILLQQSRARKAGQLLTIQQSLNTKLVEMDKIKSRFFANISHEFRTPLTLIISPIEEKLSHAGLLQKEKISFQSIKRSANRLLELINQVLELSKLESGFMKLNMQPGKLYPFIMPILSSFDSLADVSQVRYSKDVRIPEVITLFDGDKLEKILTNLLSNAFKFSPKGEAVDLTVLAVEKNKSLGLKIEIKNSGAVIPQENFDKIFEPFFQGENNPASAIPGTGLGLSLVRELVKLHAGEIKVLSSIQDGTIFLLTLNFELSDLPEVKTITENANVMQVEDSAGMSLQSAVADDDTKETILIVEDSQDVRTLIRHGLEEQYNIIEAATGNIGVELVREKNIDLVVSDVMMPVMSGVELCHILKNDATTSHVPIILLTARADHESKLEGLRTGADDYVTKPFNMEELRARVNNLIGQRKKLIQKYHQQIVVHPHEITVTSLDERLLQNAIQFVEANLDNTELGVDKMATDMGMSRTNLHRKIKAITGQSTSEFIQDFRLRRAAILIEKKVNNISQIAYQVGFTDQSYFSKCFKKKFSVSPSEYQGSGLQ
jgi:signal transduction histidine kinase/DNA-binding response OmpR family regulator